MNVNAQGLRYNVKPKYNDGTQTTETYMDFSTATSAQLVAVSPAPGSVRKVFNLVIGPTGNYAYYDVQYGDFNVSGAWTMQVYVFVTGSPYPIPSKQWTEVVEPTE